MTLYGPFGAQKLADLAAALRRNGFSFLATH
jgi:hypothetical protein